MPEYTLDITDQVCPMTLVKAKLRLEQLAIGDLLTIRLGGAEPAENVPQSLRDHGQSVLEAGRTDDGGYVIVVRKER